MKSFIILLATASSGVFCQDAQLFSCPILPRVPDYKFQEINALQAAVLYNSSSDIDTFLDSGCDVNYDGAYLSVIETECDNPLLKRLGLKCEKEIIYSGFTALNLASLYGTVESVRKLLRAPGIDVNKASNYTSNPLYEAVGRQDNLEMVQLLVEAGADVNFNRGGKNNAGVSILGRAAFTGSVPVVAYLISKGANVNYVDKKGSTPAGIAASQDHEEVVKLLVEAGSDVNQVQGTYDQNLLMLAAISGNENLVNYLISKGGNVNAADKDGESVLYYAASYDNVEIVKTLLDAGANINYQNGKYGLSALFQAILEGKTDVALYLMRRGADIDAQDTRSYSPTYAAAEAGDPVVLKALIEAGADINDKGGEVEWTPLMRAAYKGNVEIVRILKDAGADLEAVDAEGRTALDLAEQQYNYEISDLLREK